MHDDVWVTSALKFVSTNDEQFLQDARMNCSDVEIRAFLDRYPEMPLPVDQLRRLSDRSRSMGKPREAEVLDVVGLNPLANLVLAKDAEKVNFGIQVCAYVLEVSRKHKFLGCQGRFSYLLGESKFRNREYEQARELLTESDHCYTQLCEADMGSYSPVLVFTLDSLGRLLQDTKELTKAEYAMSRAVDLLQDLVAVKPQKYSNQLATVLNNLGTLLGEQQRFSEALEVLNKADHILRDQHDLECKAILAATLTNKARALAEDGKAAAGIEVAKESIRLKRVLAQQAPEKYMDGLPIALINLSMLSGQMGAVSDAVDSAKEAVTILSALVGHSPECIPNLAVAMKNLATALLESGRQNEAQQLFERATDLYTTLAKFGPTAFQSDLKSFLKSF